MKKKVGQTFEWKWVGNNKLFEAQVLRRRRRKFCPSKASLPLWGDQKAKHRRIARWKLRLDFWIGRNSHATIMKGKGNPQKETKIKKNLFPGRSREIPSFSFLALSYLFFFFLSSSSTITLYSEWATLPFLRFLQRWEVSRFSPSLRTSKKRRRLTPCRTTSQCLKLGRMTSWSRSIQLAIVILRCEWPLGSEYVWA